MSEIQNWGLKTYRRYQDMCDSGVKGLGFRYQDFCGPRVQDFRLVVDSRSDSTLSVKPLARCF